MSVDSPRRFDRIVAILIQLQSRRVVKAQDLADRFEVSLRTIYRDIRSLEASGVPIYGEAGAGYSIMDGYRLPPVMFTREEAGSFVAAEKLMQTFTDKTLGSYFESAMFKIRSVLRGAEKDWVSALESQVAINPAQTLFNEKIPDAMERLFESIAEKKQLVLLYEAMNAEKVLERSIEPVGVFHENNYWYVLGYCHLRKDYRQFRTDRIQAIRRTETPFTRRHGSLDELRKKQPTQELVRIRILVDKKAVPYLKSGRKHYGFTGEETKGDQVEMTFMCPENGQYFPRWYVMFADHARILEPEDLKVRMNKLLQDMQARLLEDS